VLCSTCSWVSSEEGWGKEAVKAYKDGKLDTFRGKKIKLNESSDRAEGDLTPRAYQAEIEVVGCWDTVASLDIPLWPVMNAGGVSGKYKHFNACTSRGISRI